jgi:uncharacterized protein (UPF0333 family)
MEKNNFKIRNKFKSKGQVMLTAILIMGAVMAIVMAINLVVLNEVRTARQTPISAKAIAAADAGVECAMYKIFVVGGTICCNSIICDSTSDPMLDPHTSYKATVNCFGATSTISIGRSKEVQRAFEAIIPF